MRPHAIPFVTPAPWGSNLQHPIYGAEDTYRLAADWLRPCRTVADWGGSRGHFRTFLPPETAYTLVDGTVQTTDQVLADLATYRAESDGILLRHVLDNTEDWQAVLRNALASFRQRMVVVTFTPPEPVSRRVRIKSGWPIWHFDLSDLACAMAPYLVRSDSVRTTHPEHIFYLERPCAS